MPSLIGSALFQQERERKAATRRAVPADGRLEVNLTGLYSRFDADNFNQNYLAWGSNALGGGGTLTNVTVEDDTAVAGHHRLDHRTAGAAWSTTPSTASPSPKSGPATSTRSGTAERRLARALRGSATPRRDGDTEAQPFVEFGAPATLHLRPARQDAAGALLRTSTRPTRPTGLRLRVAAPDHQRRRREVRLRSTPSSGSTGAAQGVQVRRQVSPTTSARPDFQATTYGGFFLPLSATGCGGDACTPADFAGGLTPGDFLDNIALPGTLTSYWQVDRDTLEQHPVRPSRIGARASPTRPRSSRSTRRPTAASSWASSAATSWRGNVGLRVVRTDQTSRGNTVRSIRRPVRSATPSATYLPSRSDRTTPTSCRASTSASTSTPQMVLRFAAARTMARPDYTDIAPRVTLNPGALTGSGGDPERRPVPRQPVRRVARVVSGPRTRSSPAALFYKDIQSFITDPPTQEAFRSQTDTPNLSRCTRRSPTSRTSTTACSTSTSAPTAAAAAIKGFELQVSQPIWGGFGVQANYTYSDAKANNGDPIPGNSKHSFNVTGFYENDRLSAPPRLHLPVGLLRRPSTARSPLNQKSTSSLDASASFKLTRQLLRSPSTRSTSPTRRSSSIPGPTVRPRAIYDNGRQFYVGARFRY